MNSGKKQNYGHTRNRSVTVHRVLTHFTDNHFGSTYEVIYITTISFKFHNFLSFVVKQYGARSRTQSIRSCTTDLWFHTFAVLILILRITHCFSKDSDTYIRSHTTTNFRIFDVFVTVHLQAILLCKIWMYVYGLPPPNIPHYNGSLVVVIKSKAKENVRTAINVSPCT